MEENFKQSLILEWKEYEIEKQVKFAIFYVVVLFVATLGPYLGIQPDDPVWYKWYELGLFVFFIALLIFCWEPYKEPTEEQIKQIVEEKLSNLRWRVSDAQRDVEDAQKELMQATMNFKDVQKDLEDSKRLFQSFETKINN
ncbi:MAG: hypothetical protein LBO09_06270 [Candidatus Peribacteria bacterium]|jgi:hypothetical protein|nr:hypothetical protein [Candidatus Peribacteria bacterium]